MKIYIATPVNARREATLEEKRKAALRRVCEIAEKMKWHYPSAKFYSSFDYDITPLNIELTKKMYGCDMPSEPVIMGRCVQRVMECDAIFMDWGYEHSKGCTVEHTTALTYGKKIIHAYDLSIEPEK